MLDMKNFFQTNQEMHWANSFCALREIHHSIEKSKGMTFLSMNSHKNVVRIVVFMKYLWNSYNNAAYRSLLSLLICICQLLAYLNHDPLTKLEDSEKFLRTRSSELFHLRRKFKIANKLRVRDKKYFCSKLESMCVWVDIQHTGTIDLSYYLAN